MIIIAGGAGYIGSHANKILCLEDHQNDATRTKRHRRMNIKTIPPNAKYIMMSD